jgi:hypothetical protein
MLYLGNCLNPLTLSSFSDQANWGVSGQLINCRARGSENNHIFQVILSFVPKQPYAGLAPSGGTGV